MIYLLITTQRWINQNRVDVRDARKSKDPRHLQYGVDGPCPSQAQWPIQCSCVKGSITTKFDMQYGPNVIFAPATLLPTWKTEFSKWHDPKADARVDLGLVVGHGSARDKSVIQQYFWEGPRGKKIRYEGNVFEMGCKPEERPSWESQRWIILTTVGSYDTNVKQKFKITKPYREIPEGKRREMTRYRTVWRLSAGRTFDDEFTTAKTQGSGTMGLLRDIKQESYKFHCTFVAISGTPWNKSPSDMSGVISVLRHLCEDAWAAHETLRFGMPDNFKEIINAYDNMAKRNSTTPSALARFAEKRDELIVFLRDIMIMRTETSRWLNNEPMLYLPSHDTEHVQFQFPTQLQPDLDLVDAEVKRKLDQQVHDQGIQSTTKRNAMFFTLSAKTRTIADIPGLAKLLTNPGFNDDLTWASFKKKYLKTRIEIKADNPYYKNISMLEKHNPKWDKIWETIENLGHMWFKCAGDMERKRVPEKLVIMSNLPLVACITAKVSSTPIVPFEVQILLVLCLKGFANR